MPASVHAIIALVVALLATGLFLRYTRAGSAAAPSALPLAAAGGLAAALPLATVPLSPELRTLVIGTEGLIEAVTAGLLLATAVLAVTHRLPLLAIGAFIVLLEELDYGMPLLGYPDPAVMQSRSMLPGRFNFHNGIGQGLWRIVPLVTMLLLSYPGADALARRLRLPALHAQTWSALPVMALAGAATWRWLGPRALDESMELAFVALFLTAWGTCTRNAWRAGPRPQP